MTMANELLTLPEVARLLQVTLDEALSLVESRSLPAGRGEDGGVYVRRRDLDAYQASKATA
jgi:helix-turn-helix protein